MITTNHARKGSLLLRLRNNHVAGCGPVPKIDARKKTVAYFENCYGEQFVFIGDRKKKTALLLCGDAGWGKRYRISAKHPRPNLVVHEGEAMWIVACMVELCQVPRAQIENAWNADCDAIIAILKKEHVWPPVVKQKQPKR
jgi:hypothetical protein